MTTRPHARGAGHWIAALLVLLVPAGYGGVYLLLLDPLPEYSEIAEFNGSFSIMKLSPAYRIDNAYVKPFFAPAHAVDRWLRPNRWEDSTFEFHTSRHPS